MTKFESFGYETNEPCEVCGKRGNNRIEPRFSYVVCEKHFKLTPIQVSESRKTKKQEKEI
jgi:hypothetical protein